MREYLEQLLIVLAIGSGIAILAKRVNAPYNVALVVVGLLLVLMDVLPRTTMDPNVVLLLFLPILVFQGALSADDVSMKRAARPILALAVPGVAISLVATATIAAWEIGLPFAVALLLGAVLAITDTVSVLLAFRSVRVPHKLAAIMEGESLFNDGTALVLVSVCATVVMQGYADPSAIGRMLLVAIVAGVLLGAVGGTVGAFVLRNAPDDLTAILASLVAVFATSLLTEHLHGSAVIAVVVAGVLVGHEMRTHLEPSRVLALQGFWEVAAFVINVWLFLLVGIQLSGDMLVREAWPILLAVVALHAGRAVAVYICFGALHLSGQGVPWSWQHVMVFGNVKGALSMAAVLALPQGIAYRDRLIAIVFGVTLVTLLTQALPFRRFLTWLGVAGVAAPPEVDNSRAVLIGARRAQLELDQLLASGLISRREHAERRAAFQRDIIDAERVLRAAGRHSHEDVVLPAVLIAQKAAILDAERRGLITERAAGEHVAALDEKLLEAAAGEHSTEHAE
ncbi:MAG TPA: sodium:proton antiporter [Vicinamibacterales bacterium]|nr:sodium:proton antiporter [Vicinamibacterales bacterium]